MRLPFPPVLLLYIFAALMALLDRFLPFGEFEFFGRQWLIWGLGIGSPLLVGAALYQFLKARTSLDPLRLSRTRALVTGGIYRYSRNPMYLAMLLLLLAWGLYLGNAFNTLLAALFVSCMNRFQIRHEEAALLRQFGKTYQNYCIQVRRWF